MKNILVLFMALSALPAFAGTFEDRERAIQSNQADQITVRLQRANLARNQTFLAMLRRVVDAHKGLKAAITCDTESAENSVANDPRRDLSYELAGHGLEVAVRYVPRETSGGFMDERGMHSYASQPEPGACSLDLRDGEACDVRLESDENGSSDDVHLEATCISASLKKTRLNLGKIAR